MFDEFINEQNEIAAEVERIERTNIGPSETLTRILEENESTPVTTGIKLGELLRRPELDYQKLAPIDKIRPPLSDRVILSAEILVKYAGYIKRQIADVERFAKLEGRKLPADFDYSKIGALRLEAIAKLNKIKPVWVELGLQTSNEKTAEFIGRCYENSEYESAVRRLHAKGIYVITHMIAGLSGEDINDIKNTLQFIINNKNNTCIHRISHYPKICNLSIFIQ
jgi:hypothetical protein